MKLSRLVASLGISLFLTAGCEKKNETAAAGGGAAGEKGACVLKCEGQQVACKDDVPKADCTDPAKKSTIFEALPKCPHEASYLGGSCPK